MSAIHVTEKLIDRFFKLLGTGTKKPNGCILWLRHRDTGGYGQMEVDGRGLRAHRVSYAIFVGPPPKGFDVCHRCDVRNCINPVHLFLGTRKENMADMVKKGRGNHGIGEDARRAKLTNADVLEIRERHEAGQSNKDIAAHFKIDKTSAWAIATRRRWTHI